MPTERKYHPLDQSPLYKLRSRSKLARLLGVTNAELKSLCGGDILYTEFDIPKKTGGVRHVENPRRGLKLVQARLARRLARITPPDFLFCPVKGRCYVSNAAQHIGNRTVRCLDVKKFYPSTPARRVFWFFHTIMRCNRDIAGLLTCMSTYKEHLPTGSPLSPILAYFSFFDAWQAIALLCSARGQTLTVYVDDITISGSNVTALDMWNVKQVLHRAGLKYHKEKAYHDRPAEVTGVIVDHSGLLTPNRQLHKLYKARDDLRTASEGDKPAIQSRMTGLAGQVAQISAAQARFGR